MIEIRPDGIYAVDWKKDSEKGVRFRYPLHALRFDCRLAEGLTFGQFLAVVASYPELVEFIAAYSHCDVEAFLAEARLPCTPPEDDDLVALEIYRVARVHFWGHEAEYQDYVTLHGLGSDPEAPNWAIEMTPVNQMVHLRLVLKRADTFDVDRAKRDDQDHLVIERIPVEFSFSLLEVLDAVFYEIGFYGSPTRRDETRREFFSRVRQVQAGAVARESAAGSGISPGRSTEAGHAEHTRRCEA